MSTYYTTTIKKIDNGKAMSDDPKYRGLTIDEAKQYQAFLDRHKTHIFNEESAKPSLTETKYEIFIREMVQHGDRYIAYRAAYPTAPKPRPVPAQHACCRSPK